MICFMFYCTIFQFPLSYFFQYKYKSYYLSNCQSIISGPDIILCWTVRTTVPPFTFDLFPIRIHLCRAPGLKFIHLLYLSFMFWVPSTNLWISVNGGAARNCLILKRERKYTGLVRIVSTKNVVYTSSLSLISLTWLSYNH